VSAPLFPGAVVIRTAAPGGWYGHCVVCARRRGRINVKARLIVRVNIRGLEAELCLCVRCATREGAEGVPRPD